MAFTKDQLLLSADKVSALEDALTTTEVDNPLQFLCDEAEATVQQMTAGYVIEETALRNFTRSLALWKVYTNANVPPPLSVKEAYDSATKELEAIAGGKRPNLPRSQTGEARPATGKGGSLPYVRGRTEA